MYCTQQDIENILTEKITVGSTNIGTPSPGGQSQKDTVTPDLIRYYIDYAGQFIDAKLRPMYVTPLRRVKPYETEILANISSGTNVDITVHDAFSFDKFDTVRVKDSNNSEDTTVESVVSATVVQVSSLSNSYDASDEATISSLKYPDPIKLMAARYAVAFLFDRLFNAEQATNESAYGVNQRNLAKMLMYSILTGQVRLMGQNETGRRFVRGQVMDAYTSPAEITFGQEDK